MLILGYSVLLDASVRRFRSHKICLRALAAVRWVNARNIILQGQNQHAGHTVALQQIDYTLGLVSFTAKHFCSFKEIGKSL